MEEDLDFEADFIGRGDYLKKLDDAWRSRAVFGVFGIKSVGKSRLVKEFFRRKTKGSLLGKDQDVITVEMKEFEATLNVLYMLLCSALGQELDENTLKTGIWKETIIHVIREKTKLNNVTIVFDNAENFLEEDKVVHDEFLSLCVMLVKCCRGLRIIVTSTIKFVLSQIRNAYCQMELLPMTNSEGIQLLKQEAVGVDLDGFEEEIVNLCEGLPHMILMAASVLKEDDGLIQPNELVDLLLENGLKILSREFYPAEDRVADVYTGFLQRLPNEQREQPAALKFVQGSFRAVEAKDILVGNEDRHSPQFKVTSVNKMAGVKPIIRPNHHGNRMSPQTFALHRPNEEFHTYPTARHNYLRGSKTNAENVVRNIGGLGQNFDENCSIKINTEHKNTHSIPRRERISFCEECRKYSLTENCSMAVKDSTVIGDSEEINVANFETATDGKTNTDALSERSTQLCIYYPPEMNECKQTEVMGTLRSNENGIKYNEGLANHERVWMRPSGAIVGAEHVCLCDQCQTLIIIS